MSEELVDIVDESNKVLGKMSKGECHKTGNLHRTVSILVYSPSKEVLLQRRSPEKKDYPGYYDVSASGHVMSGESYLTAAIRELKEEVGLDADPQKLKENFDFRIYFENRGSKFNDFVRCFSYDLDNPKKVKVGEEVQEARFMTSEEAMGISEKGQFTPTALKALQLAKIVETT
jgi:isopentenyl-diphosphate delta-isomerase type 1